MNERQKNLLRLLLVSPQKPRRAKDLANSLDCSEKTVRNDLKQIATFLADYPDAELIKKPGAGVHLDIQPQRRGEIFKTLHQSKTPTNQERLAAIAYRLLINDKPITYKELAGRYYTNTAAIHKDMQYISSWLLRFDLILESKQRVGNIVKGKELNKRNALARISELITNTADQDYVLDLFPSYEIDIVQKLLKKMQRQYALAWTDGAFESLLIHALIMIRRTRQSSTIVIAETEQLHTQQSKAYVISKYLLELLEGQLQIKFPESELVYFAWHISSSKQEEGIFRINDDKNELTQKITDLLIKKLHRLTGMNFSEDQLLADGLRIHLHAVVNRVLHGFLITNPLLDDIKKMYPYLFSMIVLALEELQETFDLSIPEDEAAYLVLHFQAAIERLEKTRETTHKVLIVCHLGLGMSRLLQAKLEQQYKDIEIIGSAGKGEVADYVGKNPLDLIISTVKLDKPPVPYVMVTPLLDPDDQARLSRFFQEMDEKNHAVSEVIGKYLDKHLIYTDVKPLHRFEVVEMLANELVKKGFVKKEFVHSALLRERDSATAIGGGVAIPHARPDTVKQSVISVAVMEQPIFWGEEKVAVIFLLAVKEGEQQITREIMQEVAAIAGNPDKIAQFEQAGSPAEIYEMLDGK